MNLTLMIRIMNGLFKIREYTVYPNPKMCSICVPFQYLCTSRWQQMALVPVNTLQSDITNVLKHLVNGKSRVYDNLSILMLHCENCKDVQMFLFHFHVIHPCAVHTLRCCCLCQNALIHSSKQ